EREQQQPGPAEADYRRAVTLLSELRESWRGRAVYRYDLAIAHQDLGNLLWGQDRQADALREQRAALELLQGLVNDFPERPGYRKKLANTYNSLGAAYARSGAREEAAGAWDRASSLFARLVEEF